MEIIDRVVEYTGDPVFTLWHLTDQHIGTVHHDRKLWLEHVEAVRQNPYAVWICGGDGIEAITHKDKRHAPEEIDPAFGNITGRLIDAQRDRFTEDLRPIASKGIGIHMGNHEATPGGDGDRNIVRDVCIELENEVRNQRGEKLFGKCDKKEVLRYVPYLSDTAFIRLTFRKMDDDGNRLRSCTKIIYSEHGACNATTESGVLTYLNNLMREFEADIYLTGHCHKNVRTSHPKLSIPRSSGSLIAMKRLAQSSAGFYRTYIAGHSSYGQRKSYSPTELGCIKIRIRPNTGEMEVVA